LLFIMERIVGGELGGRKESGKYFSVGRKGMTAPHCAPEPSNPVWGPTERAITRADPIKRWAAFNDYSVVP